MKLHSPSLEDHVLPTRCAGWGSGMAALGLSPGLSWTRVPAGARSFVITCFDLDAVDDWSLINVSGVEIGDHTLRKPACHWLVVDLPAELRKVEEGQFSAHLISPVGLPHSPETPGRCGLVGPLPTVVDDDLVAKTSAGYVGPCPPFNDRRPHRCLISLHALSVDSAGLVFPFGPDEVAERLDRYSIASSSLEAIYAHRRDDIPTS